MNRAVLTFKSLGLLSALLVLLAPSRAFAVGETGAVELKIPQGARPIAMGQAFVAVADDANSIYWNPAGLRSLGGVHIMLQHDVFIDTVRYNYIAGGLKAGNDLGLGLSVMMLGVGTIEEVDGSGTVIGEFGADFMNVNLAAALRLNYQLDVGLTAKYIGKTLADVSASSFAVDLGLLYKTPMPKLTAGLNIQNLNPLGGLKFDQQEDPLPLNIRMGLAYRMFEDNFTLALDGNVPIDNAVALSLGGEYWYMDTLVGRFGYRFQGTFDQNQYGIGGKAGLYLGAGIKVKAFGNYVGFDYAWTDAGFFGPNHHFALDVYL